MSSCCLSKQSKGSMRKGQTQAPLCETSMWGQHMNQQPYGMLAPQAEDYSEMLQLTGPDNCFIFKCIKLCGYLWGELVDGRSPSWNKMKISSQKQACSSMFNWFLAGCLRRRPGNAVFNRASLGNDLTPPTERGICEELKTKGLKGCWDHSTNQNGYPHAKLWLGTPHIIY